MVVNLEPKKKKDFVEIKIPKDLMEQVKVIVERSDSFSTVEEFALTALILNAFQIFPEASSNVQQVV